MIHFIFLKKFFYVFFSSIEIIENYKNLLCKMKTREILDSFFYKIIIAISFNFDNKETNREIF